jgi:hypothetical protein
LIADDTVSREAADPGPGICADAGGPFRSARPETDGAIEYVCCGYTVLEIEELRDLGDEYAAGCLAEMGR